MSQNCPPGTFAYVIQSGDTYYQLAQRYGTTVNQIIAANPGVDPNRLRIGQVICIPTTQPPVQCPAGTVRYVVQAGDSLYSIARRFNVSMDAIIAANPNVDFDEYLAIGMVLCIPTTGPQPGTCPANTFAYTIKAGDTYWSIAARYQVSVDALIAANPGVNPDNLQIGQVICVPGTQPPPSTCPANTFAYTIKAGDTYWSLAARYQVSVDALIAANPGVNPDNLQIGQVICVPRST